MASSGELRSGTLSINTTATLGVASAATGVLRLYNAGSTYLTSFQAGVATGAAAYTLPTALPTVSGQALLGTTGGVLSWGSAPAGSIAVGTTAVTGGAAGRLLFEGAGNVIQESSSLSWDGTNLAIVGTLSVPTLSTSGALAITAGASSNITLTGQGLRLPTKADPDPTGVAGLLYFNTTSNKLRWFDGSSWSDIGPGGGSPSEGYNYIAVSNMATHEFQTPKVIGIATVDLANSNYSGTYYFKAIGSLSLAPAGSPPVPNGRVRLYQVSPLVSGAEALITTLTFSTTTNSVQSATVTWPASGSVARVLEVRMDFDSDPSQAVGGTSVLTVGQVFLHK